MLGDSPYNLYYYMVSVPTAVFSYYMILYHLIPHTIHKSTPTVSLSPNEVYLW